STAHQRSKLRRRNVEICFRAGFAQNFFNSDAVCSHYQRTKAALGASDNLLKHFLEHVALQLRTLTAECSRSRRSRTSRTIRQRSTQQLRLSRCYDRRLRLRLLLQLSRRRRVARRVPQRNWLRNRYRALSIGHCSRNRPALIVGTVDVRRDEEEDFTV